MITVNNVSLRFGKRTLFEGVNLKFTPGNCYGIIGANGAGKSTFLKLLSGEIETTSGEINIGKDERISVLKQDHNLYNDYRVIDTVIMGNKRLYEIIEEKNFLYTKEPFTDKDGIKLGELESEFAFLNGWQAESDAAILLSGLGVDIQLHELTMKEIPTKEKVKVLLAQALFGNPDVLLLDEPTNGLDIEAKIWLEEFLINFENTILVVSHDRHFLNKVCTHIVDIDYEKITLFVGNYDFWYKSSELIQKQMRDSNKKKEEKIKELKLINNLNLTINNYDKIAFIGNEIIITTLFKVLSGEIKPDSGEVIWGNTVLLSYFPHNNDNYFKSSKNIVEWLMSYSNVDDVEYVRGFLGRMLFSGEDALKKVDVLSGGEKVRCMLSKMMLSGANTLILDQPTDHLDVETITSLNNALINFKGVVLFSTHDHEFMETVANRIIEFKDDGKYIDKMTTYEEYLKINK